MNILTTQDPLTALVSIIMPAYNADSYIKASINSVLKQHYQNWELLIVDDASTDTTLETIKQFQAQDSRIKVTSQKSNQGVAKARNTALTLAKGKYIAFLDSDDLWYPEKLNQQISYMESSGALITYSAYQRINENGDKLGTVSPPSEIVYKDLLKSNFIGNLTGIYNAEVLSKQFFTQFKHEDYVAWLALLKKAQKAQAINSELAQYRVYEGSVSSNKIKALFWQWRIYRQAESLSLVHSSWLMLNYAYFALAKRT